ncbi:MAG TPA: lipase family protein [Thermoanaerobaculia bacterium]|nr:lipase family protein [Thermoanaerobaculia bacterium]
MLEFRNTPDAVFSPGRDSNYFDQLTLAAAPLQLSPAYSAVNAWWLAELSRVIYRESVAEGSIVLPDRTTVLRNAGLTEVKFADGKSTEAAIIDVGPCHVLAFRGTEDLKDWLRNIDVRPDDWDGPGRAHKGFVGALNEVWREQLHPVLRSITGPIFYTGHSLGAALAILAAARIEPDRRPLAVYTYGGPRCGDTTFASEHPLRDRIHRVVNNRDLVTRMPPGYKHTGELHYITSDRRLLTNPTSAEMADDRETDDPTHSLRQGDFVPELFTDHAPQNYVAWMQRFALGL